jgi:hypothetical protein
VPEIVQVKIGDTQFAANPLESHAHSLWGKCGKRPVSGLRLRAKAERQEKSLSGLVQVHDCQHRGKREPVSSVLREPGFDGLIGGDAVENSILVSIGF